MKSKGHPPLLPLRGNGISTAEARQRIENAGCRLKKIGNMLYVVDGNQEYCEDDLNEAVARAEYQHKERIRRFGLNG